MMKTPRLLLIATLFSAGVLFLSKPVQALSPAPPSPLTFTVNQDGDIYKNARFSSHLVSTTSLIWTVDMGINLHKI
jgi:hypothetical protein